MLFYTKLCFIDSSTICTRTFLIYLKTTPAPPPFPPERCPAAAAAAIFIHLYSVSFLQFFPNFFLHLLHLLGSFGSQTLQELWNCRLNLTSQAVTQGRGKQPSVIKGNIRFPPFGMNVSFCYSRCLSREYSINDIIKRIKSCVNMRVNEGACIE